MTSINSSLQTQEDWDTVMKQACPIKVIYCILPEWTERASWELVSQHTLYTILTTSLVLNFFFKEHSHLKKSKYLHINKTYIQKIETSSIDMEFFFAKKAYKKDF